jgi:hypothetical protein
MFKLTLALLAVLALTGSALAQISEWHGGSVDKKGTSRLLHHHRQLPQLRWCCAIGLFASVEDKSMASALPVGDLSVRMRNDRHEPNGVKKNSDQSVFQ